MDKSWINLEYRNSPEYFEGVDLFLNFAYTNEPYGAAIKCPCKKCHNLYYMKKLVVREHLIVNGFMPNYKNWTLHGEPYIPMHANLGDEREMNNVVDNMVEMLHDTRGTLDMDVPIGNDQPYAEHVEGLDEETIKFFKLLEDAKRELYPNCKKFTSLSFIVRLLNIKVLCGWTNKSFTLLLELLNEVIPDGTRLAKSYYEANKITVDLGFSYETWDACPNSCMLFRNENKDLDKCDLCNTSRYKNFDGAKSSDGDSVNGDKKIPAKQVRYFPLKPRLQRLFMSRKTALLMKWHSEERTNDGVLRHPADTPAWKSFDKRYLTFASDSRNVRLGLAADGFNPFGTMSIAHSTWPVVLMPYNLPPWLCMKQPFFILSVLIDGPKGPGDKIDVYLQPLIEELKDLWENGVLTYDASTKQMFTLHASLLWTINDFPAYANLSGWSTKGKFACPCCNKDTKSHWLIHGGKYCYLSHRRFLDKNHSFRRDKFSFDGKWEWDLKPKTLLGSELLKQLQDVETIYRKEDVLKKRKREELEKELEKKKKAAARKGKGKGKEKGKGKRKEKAIAKDSRKDSWKKKSIFFELPYWEHNLIRHNLDIMHIEKNVCDNVLFTLLGIARKSKDSLKARRDLVKMGIRKPLHPKQTGSGKIVLPPACFTMSNKDKDTFLKVLKDIKVPDGYASNISRCVHTKERSIWGLKSHDNHILMQQLLPLAIRRALPKNVVGALIELANFFRQLCSKVNSKYDLEKIQDRIALTLCHLEKIFPPAFFDIMEHLPIHLADEALIAGAVQFRWMYPIERYLCTLKRYVRQRAHPEGSIAKGYLVEECMIFCGRYLDDVETKSTRPSRNDDGDDHLGRHFGKAIKCNIDKVTWAQTHSYVLANTDAVKPFRDQHLAELKREKPRAPPNQIDRDHNENFHTWFREHVNNCQESSEDHQLSDEIMNLAKGPHEQGRRFKGYIINGFRFRTKKSEKSRTTQNSGVILNADTRSYASRKDKNPCSADVTFYGELTDIVEIRYTNEMKFVLFKCRWIDNNVGKREDEFNFTSVNFKHLLYKDNKMTDEPFILASQAEQIMFVEDPMEPNWRVIVKMTSRDLFDMYSNDHSLDTTEIPQATYSRQALDETRIVHEEDVTWVRHGVDERTIDPNAAGAVEEDESDAMDESDVDESSDMDESDDMNESNEN